MCNRYTHSLHIIRFIRHNTTEFINDNISNRFLFWMKLFYYFYSFGYATAQIKLNLNSKPTIDLSVHKLALELKSLKCKKH